MHKSLIFRFFVFEIRLVMTTEQTLQLTVESLTKVNETLTRQNETQSVQIAEMSHRIKELTAQLAYFQRRMFGRSSEKNLNLDGQLSLFDAVGIEIPTDETPSSNTGEEDCGEDSGNSHMTKKSRKGSRHNRINLDNLPVLETRILKPGQPVDLSRYRLMGYEETYRLGFEPGKFFRILEKREKYGLIDPTEPVERGQGIIVAPVPKLPIAKGIADASVLTEILLQKYEYHMPFYRQIKQFAHLGVTGLKEATLVGWYKRTMELLRPLYDLLVSEVFHSDYVQADETTIPVINTESHQADKEYLWMARAVMERLAVFFYDDGSRAGHVIRDKTDGHNFHGYLQSDGYGGYTAAFNPGGSIVLVACLVHIRRAFEKALDENRKPASWFLGKIREIYHIDHECDRLGMDFAARKAERNLKMRPVMEEMRKWMETEGIHYSERTLIGKAVTYAYNRWNSMMRVLDDGRLKLDNNLAENEIRPIPLGRKNYLFNGNHESAENMCVIASLLATCRNHDINPRLYLNDVIATMPRFEKASPEEIARMLPHHWKHYHPEAIMTTSVRNLAK